MKDSKIDEEKGNIPEELIETKEVAKRLKISGKSVTNHRNKGNIPFVMVGRSVRYNWNDVYRAYSKQSAA